MIGDSARGQQRFFSAVMCVRWKSLMRRRRARVFSKSSAKAELTGRCFSWQSAGSRRAGLRETTMSPQRIPTRVPCCLPPKPEPDIRVAIDDRVAPARRDPGVGS
jgi:hypothetical protein